MGVFKYTDEKPQEEPKKEEKKTNQPAPAEVGKNTYDEVGDFNSGGVVPSGSSVSSGSSTSTGKN